jgi:hypothetical protein
MQQRRKSVFASAPFAMKQAALGAGVAARKNGAPLSLAAVVFALFVFATFLYNEDIKSITDFQFSSGAIRAKSPDLHLLQEAEAAAHAAVNTLAKRGEEVIVRVLEAPAAAGAGAGALVSQAAAVNTTSVVVAAAAAAKANANANAVVDVGQEKERGRGGRREGRVGQGGGRHRRAADRGERAGDVRPVPWQLGVRRGERARVQGGRVRVPD